MPRNGKARIPTQEELEVLYDKIAKNRHPEKNRALIEVSFKLGLRVQEISLLQIKEVAELFGDPGASDRDFALHKVMALPAMYTKGSGATKRSQSKYARRTVSFKVDEFDALVEQIKELTLAGVEFEAKRFYPKVKKNKGKTRQLPLVDEALIDALNKHIQVRLEKDPYLKPTSPLFVSQKGGAYSPNTLQEHFAMMLRKWAQIEKSSSHSGRRALATDILHTQQKPISVIQQILGHVNPSTSILYAQPTEKDISDALENSYKK
jgi:integrase